MNTPSSAPSPRIHHRGPHPGLLAIVFALLFNAGLYFVVTSRGESHFPGPWEPANVIVGYFQTHPSEVLLCAFLQFGASIPLGIFTATMVSRLRFLGVRAAGADIAYFGGLATSLNVATCALILWVMAYPGIAQDAGVLRALYYLMYAFGGVGFSVPLGLLIAGISIPAGLMKLLPKWLTISGFILAICGELSSLNLLFPKALFLIPVTRFPGFLWLIAAGFLLPQTVAAGRRPSSREAAVA